MKKDGISGVFVILIVLVAVGIMGAGYVLSQEDSAQLSPRNLFVFDSQDRCDNAVKSLEKSVKSGREGLTVGSREAKSLRGKLEVCARDPAIAEKTLKQYAQSIPASRNQLSCEFSMESDINQNGVVDVSDLLILLAQWGKSDPIFGDVDGDGFVDVFDLLILLSNWGPVVECCGDGVQEPGEECDDGDNIDGDGCSAICELEGVSYPLFSPHPLLRLYLNDSIDKVRDTLVDGDLPNVLADGEFFGNAAVQYTHLIKIGPYPRIKYSQQPTSNDDPQVNIDLSTNPTRPLYNASVIFSNEINFAHPDSEGKNITLFGKNFVVGIGTNSERLELIDDKEETYIFIDGSEILFGEFLDTIDGTRVDFDNSVEAFNRLTISVASEDSDVDAILPGETFIDPVFGTFGIDFRAINPAVEDLADREIIEIDNSGDDRLNIWFREHRGFNKTVNWLLSDGNGTSVLADSSGDLIHVREAEAVNHSHYVVVSDEREGYLLEVITVQNSTVGFENDKVRFKDVFSGETYDASITSEGSGTLWVDGNPHTLTYLDSPSSADSSLATVRLKYFLNFRDAVVFPTIKTSKGAKIAFYQPTEINYFDFDGNGITLRNLKFPNGDEYSDFNVSQLSSGDSAIFSVGELNYRISLNNDLLEVKLLDEQGDGIDEPAIILIEEMSDLGRYDVAIIQTEGDGTSQNGVGVGGVDFTLEVISNFITHETDTDFSSLMTRWGSHFLMDATTSDQKSLMTGYNDEQMSAELYVVEIF